MSKTMDRLRKKAEKFVEKHPLIKETSIGRLNDIPAIENILILRSKFLLFEELSKLRWHNPHDISGPTTLNLIVEVGQWLSRLNPNLFIFKDKCYLKIGKYPESEESDE